MATIKIEDRVKYPLIGLDLSAYSSGAVNVEQVYDLQSRVCHFGNVVENGKKMWCSVFKLEL